MNIKVQCNCGCRYGLDLEKDEITESVQFHCKECGEDLSEALLAELRSSQSSSDGKSKASVRLATQKSPDSDDSDRCLSHPGQAITTKCKVCGKAMCGKCMEPFGSVCSGYCRTQAKNQGLELPDHVNPKAHHQLRSLKLMRVAIVSAGTLVVGLIAFFLWYMAIGSQPTISRVVSFSGSGSVKFGKLMEYGQVCLLRGDRLVRYDLEEGIERWGVDLPGSGEEVLGPHVHQGRIWVGRGDSVTGYSWGTGNVEHVIALPGRVTALKSGPRHVSVVAEGVGGRGEVIVRYNFSSGEESRQVVEPESRAVLALRSRRRQKVQSTPVEGDVMAVDYSRTEWLDGEAGFLKMTVDLVKSQYGPGLTDNSVYRASLERVPATGAVEWSDQTVGPPVVFPLEKVNVVVAGKRLIALDQNNENAWEHTLEYRLPEGEYPSGGGWLGVLELVPVRERSGTVMVFDRGGLTALDSISGRLRWRLASVGISALHFDSRGTLYVVSTDAGIESIQEDSGVEILRQDRSKLLKVDPRDGSVDWEVLGRGFGLGVTGEFLYSVESSERESDPFRLGLDVKEHLRIHRLDLQTGEVRWSYLDDDAPRAVDFLLNSAVVLYDDRMEFLTYMSW